RLGAAAGQRTLVVVTHRPAVLEVVNRIIVVDNGRIMADGPKTQVLAALSGQPPQAAKAPARSKVGVPA
nr:hypothetical protein [Vitreoscilla sp.]